jgi:hypothetical protein
MQQQLAHIHMRSRRNEPEVIRPPMSHKTKAAAPGGKSLDELVKLGDARVRTLANEYKVQRKDDLHEISEIARELRSSPTIDHKLLLRILNKAHDIQGLGSTFGYALITDIAFLLCRITKEIRVRLESGEEVSPRTHEAIEAHIRALEMAIGADIPGDGGEVGRRLLDGLKKAAEKVVSG